MKTAYTIYICPTCSDFDRFAGFCSLCPDKPRLRPERVIPISKVRQKTEQIASASSPVPRIFIERFAEQLLRSP